METTIVTTTVLKASEGKILRRKSDGYIAGTEIYLGYTYYLGTFENSPCLIYVPDTAVSTYKTASGWIEFASRIRPISEYKGEL